MAIPDNPHDKLFRALFEDEGRAGALLREVLPAKIAAQLSDKDPVLLEGSFVDEALRGTQSDRLFRVELKDGTPAFVFALFEHKSKPDPRTPIQLLGYMARIWERHLAEQRTTPERLPAIIPLVIYHGREPWRVHTSILDWIGAEGPLAEFIGDFRYVLHDLGPLDYPALSAHRALRAGLAALKYAGETGLPLRLVVTLLRDTPEGTKLERQVLEYVASVYDMTRAELERAMAEAKPHRWEDLMGTPAEEWIQEGKQQGLAEGLAKGKAEGLALGKADAVLRVLRGRFRQLPDALADQVRAADSDTLDAILDRALTAERPEEVLPRSKRS